MGASQTFVRCFDMTLEIRRASLTDLPSLSRLEPWLATADGQAYLERFIGAQRVTVALEGRVAAGLTVREVPFFGHEFVHKLHVSDDFRRRGVGAALMAFEAQHSATPKLFTSTNLSNSPMLALLRSQDWIYSGTLDQMDLGDPEVFFVKHC